MAERVLQLFEEMQREGLQLQVTPYTAATSACKEGLAALRGDVAARTPAACDLLRSGDQSMQKEPDGREPYSSLRQ